MPSLRCWLCCCDRALPGHWGDWAVRSMCDLVLACLHLLLLDPGAQVCLEVNVAVV